MNTYIYIKLPNSSPNALCTNLYLSFVKVIKSLKTIEMTVRNNALKIILVYNKSDCVKINV